MRKRFDTDFDLCNSFGLIFVEHTETNQPCGHIDCICGCHNDYSFGSHHVGCISKHKTCSSNTWHIFTIDSGNVWKFCWRDSETTTRRTAYLTSTLIGHLYIHGSYIY